jgi:hypothetical protein
LGIYDTKDFLQIWLADGTVGGAEGRSVDGHQIFVVLGHAVVVSHGSGTGFKSWEEQTRFHSEGKTQLCLM